MVSFVGLVTAWKRHIKQTTLVPVFDGNAVCTRDAVREDESHCHKEKSWKLQVLERSLLNSGVHTKKFSEISLPWTMRHSCQDGIPVRMPKKCGRHPNFPRACHTRSRLTMSHALVKSMKAKKVTILFPTFLLKNPTNENHINGSARAKKAALRFGNQSVNDEC